MAAGRLPRRQRCAESHRVMAFKEHHHVVITGGAGLVGQNLVALLKDSGPVKLTVLDKHAHNLNVLRALHPDIDAHLVDLAAPGPWQSLVAGASHIVLSHAQIGGTDSAEFERNNLTSTQMILEACRASDPYVVHLSSSVVNSMANDFYTETKEAQEQLVKDSGVRHCSLRPTLMFGWFDRKHLGWLSRFMRKTPLFPIPGNGRFMRQPLYVRDFCRIIRSCLVEQRSGVSYNISGLERIDYIDLMKQLRSACQARCAIVRIPFFLFRGLLQLYAMFDSDPPFTVSQLEALATPDEFEVIDWPGLFDVEATPLSDALRETYQDPTFSHVALEY